MLLQTAQQDNFPTGIFFLVLMVIWAVLIFVPQRRAQKKTQSMIDNLKVGDKVITNGGIYGAVAGLREDRIQLRVAENVKIEVARTAITALQNPGDNA